MIARPICETTAHIQSMMECHQKEGRLVPVSGPTGRESPSEKTAIDSGRRARITRRVAGKLIAAVAGSSSLFLRIAAHPIGASLWLALGYMFLCGAYIFFSGRLAANAAWSLEQLRKLEMLKGLGFVLVTGAAYFRFAFSYSRSRPTVATVSSASTPRF